MHCERAQALVEAFTAAFPDVSSKEATQAFGLFAAARGARVRIVHAQDGDHGTHPDHSWVRVFNREGIHGYDVDVTAAQFGLPAALIWRMDGQHPVTGVHRTLRVTPVVPAAG